MFNFDLGSPVVDVDWAPYSSTVFAAITIDGYVYIYDLLISSEKPLCFQKVLLKNGHKLTNLKFNPIHPILLISNDK